MQLAVILVATGYKTHIRKSTSIALSLITLLNTLETKPPFEPYKFGPTMIIAIIIGFSTRMTGSTLTEADFLVQLGAYAGYMAMLETLLKAIFGYFGRSWFRKYENS